MKTKKKLFHPEDHGFPVRTRERRAQVASAVVSSCMAAGLLFAASLTQAQVMVTQDLVLTEDQYEPLHIYTSGVTVDCQNFRIVQPNPQGQVPPPVPGQEPEPPSDFAMDEGILIYNAIDVTVRNCNIEDYWWGIRVWGGSGVKLIDNTVSELTQPMYGWVVRRAFDLVGTHDNDLIGNTEADTNGDGFTLVGSTGNLLTGNSAGAGGNAYELFSSDDNQFLNNTASAGGEGFNISNSHRNQMIANTVSSAQNGFHLYDSSADNSVRANSITGNTNGILVCTTLQDQNSLSPNRFSDNGTDIAIDASCP